MAPGHHTTYSGNPLWSDVTPIPLDDGPGPGPALASIAYTSRYATAMSYLRAIMASNECSDRALSLTEDVISMNPAHYTVWLYRAKIIRQMGKDVLEELAWLEGVSRKSLKNYQIWHHRQLLMSTLPSLPSTETHFLSRILSLDSKNYHVWTYRQWLVQHFDLFDSPRELSAVEALLREDVRNNSAWNHRWFLCFGRDELDSKQWARKSAALQAGRGKGDTAVVVTGVVVDEDLIDREISFSRTKILLAPQNQSAWNYLRGLYRKSQRPLSELKGFAQQFTGASNNKSSHGDDDDNNNDDDDLNVEEGVRSSHALDLLADIYAEEGEAAEAKRMLEALGRKWDPVRKGYWDYRAKLLGGNDSNDNDEEGEEEEEELQGQGPEPMSKSMEGLTVSAT